MLMRLPNLLVILFYLAISLYIGKYISLSIWRSNYSPINHWASSYFLLLLKLWHLKSIHHSSSFHHRKHWLYSHSPHLWSIPHSLKYIAMHISIHHSLHFLKQSKRILSNIPLPVFSLYWRGLVLLLI